MKWNINGLKRRRCFFWKRLRQVAANSQDIAFLLESGSHQSEGFHSKLSLNFLSTGSSFQFPTSIVTSLSIFSASQASDGDFTNLVQI